MYMLTDMNETYRLWSRNIELGRKALGLNQRQLAEKCEVTQATVARWENGTRIPKDHFKVRIANALHQDVQQLFPLTRSAA